MLLTHPFTVRQIVEAMDATTNDLAGVAHGCQHTGRDSGIEPRSTTRNGADGSFGTGADGSLYVGHCGLDVTTADAPIARDAIDLLTTHDGRLRSCESPVCSLLFHDASRPGTRRWCTSTRCGNKVNTKAYRTRRRSLEE